MNPKMMDILACPICKSHPLLLSTFELSGDEIIVGALDCDSCGRWYPIGYRIEGVPELLPDDQINIEKESKWVEENGDR